MAQGLRKVLDQHGYGFQYAVLRTAQELFDQRKSAWVFETTEFPVEVRGTGTRIDFILKHRSAPRHIIAECKRPNSALARWAFAKSPFVRRNRTREHYFAEQVCRETHGLTITGVRLDRRLPSAYHVPIELRTGEKGEPAGVGRNAIEEAASQVSRGLGGMVEFFAANQHLLPESMPAVLLPVVFTSAELWVTDVDLSEAVLSSGRLPDDIPVAPAAWLPLQYHMSPGVKHGHRPPNIGNSLGDILDTEYIRTIPIVSPTGIEPFFAWLTEDW